MNKLKLSLDDLQVESFRTIPEARATRGTVRANSECMYTGDDCTEFWSTCDVTNGASCNGCPSVGGGCLTDGNGGCMGYYTWEESACVCSDVYSCNCAFSEASNCHRC